MSRHDEAPEVEQIGDDERRETHPAFGVAVVTRGQGTGRSLFQSDLLHRESITLSIQTADRTRALHRDWVHPRRTLVEVEMSLAQWGALVSSIGIGSGVPVTIRRREGGPDLPGIPYEPRLGESVGEARGSVRRLLARVRETLEVVEDAVDNKRGVKALREALRMHRASVVNADSNAAFAVKSVQEATEAVTSQARADIEAQILQAQIITGSNASIEAPEIVLPQIEADATEETA